MGGGILDERNDRGLSTLPESEVCIFWVITTLPFDRDLFHLLVKYIDRTAFLQVNFLTKLVALRPGKTVRGMIKRVMLGEDEGSETSESQDGVVGEKILSGVAGRVRVSNQTNQPKNIYYNNLIIVYIPR